MLSNAKLSIFRSMLALLLIAQISSVTESIRAIDMPAIPISMSNISSEGIEATTFARRRKPRGTEAGSSSDSSFTSNIKSSANITGKEEVTMRRYSDILILRSNWSASDISVPCAKTLQLPITTLYIGETLTQNCTNYTTCKAQVLSIQRDHYVSGDTDLQYNFVIGGDGSIFEGLSWNCKVTYFVPDSKSILLSFFRGISFPFFLDPVVVNAEQYRSLELFIKANLISGNLSPAYRLMPYCCTLPGSNPGKKVYTHLTYMENFHGDECLGKHGCDIQ